MTLSLLSYNIRFGGGGREARIAEVIRGCDPDLVVLQEATDPRVVERIAGEAGMRSWAAHPGYSTGFVANCWRNP